MPLTADPEAFRFDEALADGVRGKRVFITGAGKDHGLGQAFALACGLNGAASVGVHFHSSYEEGLETVAAIGAAGGDAFPVQADVTNTGDVWSVRSYVIRHMGGLPPNLVICNSGLAERGYLLGLPPRVIEDEPPAMRRSRARQAFQSNLAESTAVIDTKVDGFLAMTHLWAGEAIYFEEPLQIVYVSSRQAIDPGPGAPGYSLANFAVLALPRILRVNLGKRADLVRAVSVCYPFVRTGMTEGLAEQPRVFERWQPRMLEPSEAAGALLQLLGRPGDELNDRVFQLNAISEGSGPGVRLGWSEVVLRPEEVPLSWSEEHPVVAEAPGGESPDG
jgi:NAD(P)-dependent dehydrogenase (short-subunit alcohol dehydrogenase family)